MSKYLYFWNSRIGGSIPVTWSYYAEFQPKSKRGAMLSFLASFWMVGNLLVAGKPVAVKIPFHIVIIFDNL